MILPGNITKTLPTINYDEIEGTIHIKGRSISPNVTEYYEEFLVYLEDCLQKEPRDLKITIEYEYFNTKTSKLLMTFFGIVKKEIVEKGYNCDIDWIVENGDEDLKDAGEDYEVLTKLKINIIEKPE